jgi:SulP family sulfate permease
VRPVEIIRTYRWAYLRYDIVAGLTVAVVTLPQAMAYALIAELPPQVGLYAAVVGAIVGALWGSSAHLNTGPTNTTSLLILSVLLSVASPGTPEYIVAAGMMAFLVGLVRLAMGLARLGMLVNFVSDSVIVGFTAGAGALILINQIRHLLRLTIPSLPSLWQTLPAIAAHLLEVHWPSAAVGAGTMALIVVLRRVSRKLPAPLLAMVVAAIAVAVLGLDARGVRVIGELPRGLPPFSPPPLFDLGLIGRIATGSFAVALIGLVEAMSIARTIASQTGQRLDSNQEFVGQGLASLACAFLSGYTCSGSFTRSAVNYEAGAKTALASLFGGVFVLIAMLVLAPLAAYVPLTALAGVLILTAIGLVDYREMARIWQSGQGDRMIMVATLVATLVLPLQYAVLSGILLSLVHYLMRTSTPRVRMVLPETEFRHFEHRPDKPDCPQLGIVEILGDLYFGAVNHIEAYILEHLAQHPSQRFLLIRMHAVDHCDISGIHALESIVRAYRERGGDVYLVRVRGPVRALMETSGFLAYLGADHVLDPRDAIGHLFYRVIDPAICIYECPVRIFQECQNLPKQRYPRAVRLDAKVDLSSVPVVDARQLWDSLRASAPPRVIDVREPSEFRRAHIPGAQSIPLPVLLNHLDQIPPDQPVVLVCRGGRRSTRATAYLREQGYDNARVLRGGMIAWENAQLLEAVDRFGGTGHE